MWPAYCDTLTHLFPCLLPPLPQKERGKVQQVARQQAWWDREAWPRAAWWVRGLGW